MLPNKAGYICREHGIKGFPNGRSHLWLGDDTACRMWSTGGLNQKKRWGFYLAPPTEVCQNCHQEKFEEIQDESSL